MKKIAEFLFEEDNSEIHSEANKIRIGKGKLINKAEVKTLENGIRVIIKPKCSK